MYEEWGTYLKPILAYSLAKASPRPREPPMTRQLLPLPSICFILCYYSLLRHFLLRGQWVSFTFAAADTPAQKIKRKSFKGRYMYTQWSLCSEGSFFIEHLCSLLQSSFVQTDFLSFLLPVFLQDLLFPLIQTELKRTPFFPRKIAEWIYHQRHRITPRLREERAEWWRKAYP